MIVAPELLYLPLVPNILLLDAQGNVVRRSPTLRDELCEVGNCASGPRSPGWNDCDQAMVAELLSDPTELRGTELERTWSTVSGGVLIEWSAATITRPGGGVEYVLLTGVEHPPGSPPSNRSRSSVLPVTSNLPMWVLERRTCRFASMNPAALSLLGYTRDSVRGLWLHHLLDWEEVPGALRVLVDMIPGIETYDVWKLRRADGAYMPLEVQMLPIDAGGHPACAVLASELHRESTTMRTLAA